MASPVAELLADLTQRGITLEPRGDSLAFHPRSKVPRELRDRLRQYKTELLRLLRDEIADERPHFNSETVPSIPTDTPPSIPDYSVVVMQPQADLLESALLSLFGQSKAPSEVLVCGKVSRRIRKTIRTYVSRHVRQTDSPTDAKNELIVLLDGQSLLSPGWIESASTALAADVGAVYCDHELLTTEGQTQYPDQVSRCDLAKSGITSPTILIRRSALIEAWQDGDSIERFLKRLAQRGWSLRKHAATVLLKHSPAKSYFEQQGLRNEIVTLFIPLSGRSAIWPELQKFLDRQTWPHKQIRLFLCDTSRDATFGKTLRDWIARCDYSDVRHLKMTAGPTGLAELPRDEQLVGVNQAMCRIYNTLRENLTTDCVWILEDDVIPPDDVLERLMQAFDEKVATVSAPYRSRFDGRHLVWSRERAAPIDGPACNGVHQLAPPLVDRPQVQDIRGSGFGCMVVRSEILRDHIFCLPPGHTHYDVRFFMELHDRWRRVVDWTCECQHLHNISRPKSKITTRHLVYHITPFATNDIWLRNVRQLLKRITLFNGRRVIAVATGDDLVPPHEVRAAFGTHEVEILTRPNSRELRENATFLPLLECVADPDPEAATFYAHAKGVAKDVLCLGDPAGSRYWRNAMYHELLDDWERIDELLTDHAIVGTHRRQHLEQPRIYPDGKSESPWHFAGTFFWFRNQDAFATTKWRDVWQPTGWGAEAWPGRMFDFDQSACVAYDGLVECYDPNSYDLQLEDE